MRFGKTLQTSVYPPWKDHYIDYRALKKLLREHEGSEDGEDGEGRPWTDEDEENFVQELVNVQLDKVNSFQVETHKRLREQTAECEAALEPVAAQQGETNLENVKKNEAIAQETLSKLDHITEELGELEKFSRINFTGFLKAAKKHDRRRGAKYKVRPLLQVRMSQLPFNSEDYSPLLYRLSAMFSFIRSILGTEGQPVHKDGPAADTQTGREAYTSHKFWVHTDNLLEVKTYILRRLPVLVYNPNTSKELDVAQRDPSLTSLYFDSRSFDLYNQKVAHQAGCRLPPPALDCREIRIRLKKKHINAFLDGTYKMEKIIHKIEIQGTGDPQRADNLKRDVEEIQEFIKNYGLEPMVRANYTHTAFQIPGDDRLRISLDTDLALIREDTLDLERPCRDPEDWHRSDIDNRKMEFPFSEIPRGEISRFPHALLEIKIRNTSGKRRGSNVEAWLSDLMSSHLVKEAPRFSKFVHGVAQLFEDNINSFPFWLSDLDTDIRQDPETAFQQEQERIAKKAEDELAVGSFLGSRQTLPSIQHLVGSPISHMMTEESTPKTQIRIQDVVQHTSPRPEAQSQSQAELTPRPPIPELSLPPSTEQANGAQAQPSSRPTSSLLRIPFSMSRYALAHRSTQPQLPTGVSMPSYWLKDTGPVRVEAKVWLANQRTFVKWQHICIMLAGISLTMYNAAGPDKTVTRYLALVYTGFAIFAGAWGWWMYESRSRLIRERSGKDFDNVIGPLVVCLGVAVALVLNFWFKYASIVWADPVPNAPSPTGNIIEATTASLPFMTARPQFQAQPNV
ncbi:vacuolar transporter chaperone 2 [Nannizzia gypsea CBS 118893]|uniref:Vacuolar transporter chaperone 2 n=1 Tax=Arthroderma gypseum (strain ATCC MYA-4604 / CBS 118893) TaxID=535722 RepID=E4UZ62_ARTGP|nr:vacuolar transporter chaperone 2 [Nannizzia gypsea CBS 118893]EFR03392.1 vacuolar transporter chaperone 2 [Nannizzia gypsea CBS 118893]